MIRIGKYIIENLTVGMYSESKIIFREYIQNAADQIDLARKNNMFPNEKLSIDITIDNNTRSIIIKDNATGIPSGDVSKKLGDVADSNKEVGIDKGFRGIGRLGGLAYCDTLRFVTTYKGEKLKTIMNWDAKALLELIQDKDAKDSAQEILNQVISYKTEQCDDEEHFFIVEMINIRKDNHELLNVDEVRKYVASNAPVPYSNKFIYRNEIYNFMRANSILLNEYEIYVNDEVIHKNYGTYLYENISGQAKKYDEIFNIRITKIERDNGEVLAWMWYGISRYEKAIPESVNEMRGLRLRQSNIQLGDDRTLTKFFKESRGNSYFVGEIHVIHKGLIPNARRDYFNENIIRYEFEVILQEYFETLHKLYHGANKAKIAYRKNINLKLKEQEYQDKQSNGFVNEKERETIERELKTKDEENCKAERDLKNLIEKTSESDPLVEVIKKIKEKFKSEIKEINRPDVDIKKRTKKAVKPPNTPGYVTQCLSKLDKKQQKLVSRIYGVIKDELQEDLSNELINKIQNELNK